MNSMAIVRIPMLFFFIQTALSLPVFRQNSETGPWYINGPVFDRDRAYAALGYMLTDRLGIQAGYMSQILENSSKGQLQLSLHHNFL